MATHTYHASGETLTAAHWAVGERDRNGVQVLVDLCESATEKTVLKKIELAPTGGQWQRINGLKNANRAIDGLKNGLPSRARMKDDGMSSFRCENRILRILFAY